MEGVNFDFSIYRVAKNALRARDGSGFPFENNEQDKSKFKWNQAFFPKNQEKNAKERQDSLIN